MAGNFKYAYTLPGQYQTITFPSGATRNFSYDDQGRLTQLSNVDPIAGNLATYAYGYDFNYTTGLNTMLGQRVSTTATVPSQSLNSSLFKYEYDSVYELTKATYPNVAPFNAEVDSWTYDGIGNRLTSTVSASTQTYTYQKITGNPNNWQRLLSDGVSSYTYDLNGSTITKNGTPGNFTFGWNFDNRMSSISGAAAATYGYDYQGRRRTKTVSSSTSNYLYDGLNLIAETGATPADYLFGPGIDEPLAMSRSGLVYYYGVDGLGSVATVANSGGAVQDSYLYDAWGQTRTQTGTLVNPFGYTAREFGEAGTLFYRARYYQPSIARFLSEDPRESMIADPPPLIRYLNNILPGPPLQWPSRSILTEIEVTSPHPGDGANLYSMGFNDPLHYTDPGGSDGIPGWIDWLHWVHVAICAHENLECGNRVNRDCECDWNKRRGGPDWIAKCKFEGWQCCRDNFYRCLVGRPRKPCHPLLFPPRQAL